jgi:ribonuclease G
MDVRPLRDAAPGPFRQAGQPCTPYPGNQGVPAMSTELLINVTPQETRVAVIENGVVQEILIERANRRGLVGNIYKGRVCRVLPGMQAAFVDIGLARAAFLHASDVVAPAAQRDRPPPAPDPDGNGAESAAPGAPRTVPDITDLLHEGQDVLVQVIKDPLGTKGARLTTHLSIPARYLVFMPGAASLGVSQKIEDEAERTRLRELVREFARRRGDATSADSSEAPADGYIVRTAAESVSDEMLAKDMEFLDRLWSDMRDQARDARAPAIVHEDLALALRTLRELSGTDLERIRIDSRETFRRAIEFTRHYIPEITARIEHYGEGDERPIFELHGVEAEIQKALSRKVQLKSGGHLIIDQTEAMTTIDVNTGAYVGFRNLEETTFKTNLEATQAIARQLRLRNLGGIIIIDFIDMTSDEHRRQVLRALEKSLARDPTKTHISNVSALGLVQMTRKRTRESLEHVLCEPCPTCAGRGTIKTPDTVCYEIFREILREARQFDAQRLLVLASPEVIDTLVDEESVGFAELEAFIGKPITLQAETQYFREQFDVVLM